jgi:hypothetical protein
MSCHMGMYVIQVGARGSKAQSSLPSISMASDPLAEIYEQPRGVSLSVPPYRAGPFAYRLQQEGARPDPRESWIRRM